MASAYYRDIQKLYVSYFSRPADVAGLQYWASVVEANGGGTAAVAAAFAQSSEYRAAYADLDNLHIVDTVYQNLFGHAPDANGLNFWAKGLGNGSITLGQAVTAIAAGAQGTDLIALTDKVIAANVFTSALDTPAEAAAYAGAQAGQIGKVFLAQVIDDASLLHAFELDDLKKIFVTPLTAAPSGAGAGHAAAMLHGHEAGASVGIVGMPAVQPDHLV
jgi:hypothetical protein